MFSALQATDTDRAWDFVDNILKIGLPIIVGVTLIKSVDQLKQLATQKGVTLSDKLSPAKQKDVDKYNKLSGAAFDRSYISHMVTDHKQDVAEFQKESKNGKDADLKSWASTTLPTLQDHLKMAQETSSKLHGGSKKSGK